MKIINSQKFTHHRKIAYRPGVYGPTDEYKGHQISIERDVEGDNIKRWFVVTKPDGEKVMADLDPYSEDLDLAKLWIDLGYPDPRKLGRGPWTMEELQEYAQQVKM